MMGFATVDDKAYMPVTGFTTVELGCERGDNAYTVINKFEAPFSQQYLFLFDQLWNDSAKMQVVTDKILDNISNVYKENAPDFIYFVTLHNIFREFLDDLSEDDLTNEDGDPHPALLDFSDPYMVWYLVRWAEEHGPGDLVELADAINAALNN